MPVFKDRIKDTTTTTGTGTLTLANAAPTGFRTFGTAYGADASVYYTIDGGSEWEVGLGTYTHSGTTLSRTTVIASSNAGSAVNFSAGTKQVFATVPATVFAATLRTNETATVATGYTFTAYSLGNMTNFTPAASNGNYQYGTNNGAFTLTAPTSDCAIDILVTNHATTAGTITFSGFSVPSGGGGDTYATTGNNKYLLLIRRINGTSTYAWKALQ